MLLQRTINRRDWAAPDAAPIDGRGSLDKPMPQVSGVVFDVSGVLYDGTLWMRWIFQLLSRMGMYSHFAVFSRLWEEEYLPQVNLRGQDYWLAWRQYLAALGFTPGQIDEVHAAGQTRRREFEENTRPLPQVRATLEQLSRNGIRLSVCCTGPWLDRQVADRLERLKLSDLFEHISSRHDGSGSRDAAAALIVAIQRLHATPAETAVVSCREECLLAAQAIGAQVITIDPPIAIKDAVMLSRFDQLTHLQSRSAARPQAG